MLVRVIFLCFIISFQACAEDVKRNIITFYFGKETQKVTEHPMHRFLELPLNYLGFHVVYWDLDKGLPPDEVMAPVKAIVTWFIDKKFDDPMPYIEWLTDQVRRGKRYVYFGDSNCEENIDGEEAPFEKVKTLFQECGISRHDEWVDKLDVVSLMPASPDIMKFERKVDLDFQGFYAQRAIHPQAQIWLKASYKGGGRSDLILTTPKGGCATEGFFIFLPTGQGDNQDALYAHATQWQIDPVRFLREALGGGDPVFDMSTAFGNRISFTHIDGDGWNNISEAGTKEQSSADVVFHQILKPRKNILFTIGPIAGDLDPSWGGKVTAQETLTNMAKLSHVEVASHTYSHPQIWSYYQKSRSLAEEKKQAEAPRDLEKKPFDLDVEVTGSVKEIMKYMSPDSKIKLYLWSGDCLPFEGALAKVQAAGMLNLNGGSNRFDTEFPSLTGISPFYRQEGAYLQVYAAGNNEESYTYGWSDRFFGLKYFTKTLTNTEHPYRIKPMNLYFNMFTGQKFAAVQAVQKVLDFMESESAFWCFASDYAAIVSAFPGAKIEIIGKDHWRLDESGALKTLRFDLAADKMVDMAKSKGVLGMRHFQGCLYVFLDGSVLNPEIKLAAMDLIHGPYSSTIAYLLSSTWEIKSLERTNQTLSYEVKGYGKGKMQWKMPKSGKYKVSLKELSHKKELGIFNCTGDNIIDIYVESENKCEGRIEITLF